MKEILLKQALKLIDQLKKENNSLYDLIRLKDEKIRLLEENDRIIKESNKHKIESLLNREIIYLFTEDRKYWPLKENGFSIVYEVAKYTKSELMRFPGITANIVDSIENKLCLWSKYYDVNITLGMDLSNYNLRRD